MADTMEDFSKLKVTELKKLLKEQGLPITGSKSDLVERLSGTMKVESLDSDALIDDKLLETTAEGADLEDAVLDENVDLTEPAAKPKIEPITASAKTDTKEEPNTEDKEATTKPISTSLTPAERLKLRAERFGVVNEDMKKQLRSERFGSKKEGGSKAGAGSGADVDVLKKRAERFGQVLSSSLSKVDEDERIRKRKERFGEITTATNNTPKIAKITVNANPADQEKLKKRAERFGKA
ncbi:SAP domain-containing ribonucleoprotein-like isoform X1 [Mya arenaria]|uniref:SAP domain-containing ribonucleoprotein-like isoform X1 n=1 Tax=Mya arenaria TaxID=6604 RepID=UPI0022E8924A|nr:SAP domain-containing ribonucleoprotein-like isoform X1 [Mya arenaria]